MDYVLHLTLPALVGRPLVPLRSAERVPFKSSLAENIRFLWFRKKVHKIYLAGVPLQRLSNPGIHSDLVIASPRAASFLATWLCGSNRVSSEVLQANLFMDKYLDELKQSFSLSQSTINNPQSKIINSSMRCKIGMLAHIPGPQ